MTRSKLAIVLTALIVVVSSGAVAAGGVATGSHDAVAQFDGEAAAQTGSTVDCSYPVEVTDATGETVTIEEEPERVVALGASTAQTMWSIGAQEKVVGMPVDYTTAYLNGSENRTNVIGSNLQPITENVIGLEPDLVLAANIIDNESVENLRSQGLTVVRFEGASSTADVTAKTRLTGRLVGACEAAIEVSDTTNATVERIAEATEGSENPSVYYAMGGGYTAGPDTFIGDVIATAGGDNIATAADISEYDVISEEIIAAEDPEWIVMPEGRSLRQSEAINSTTAVENDQIVTVNANYMSQPGPRVTQPLTQLAETFHPEITEEASTETDSDETATGTVETTADATDTATETDTNATGPETTDTGNGFGPGFGPVAALVALMAGSLLFRRD
ncbi:MAG: PGF-CTERM-anchored ABC transporter substrate-binding protein [Halapricum sp.]